MGWRQGEIWFDVDTLWFREADGGSGSLELHAPSFSGLGLEALTAAIPNGLAQSRRRRAELGRRRAVRKTRAAALVVGPAVALTLAAPRLGASRAAEPLAQDPPSQVDAARVPPAVAHRPETREPETSFPPVRWKPGTSHGLPYAGSLSGGTQIPVEGQDWVTWNPVTDRVPNRPHRLFGNDEVIRKLLRVMTAYRQASPGAPRVVVGDISFRGGGPMELHRSHQSGLDVDVYYPRRDGTLRAPTTTGQVDRELTQALLDAFLAVGVEKIFVGYATDLRGPGAVVVPYPNHEDHMHVRFRRPAE
ncbi:MAG TPA: penicillin-insensitive murein endopeptidase [Gaiellaceae bacterium]|nr:penicillin-insensitive murein endopeptidase [Gaiellaceae bacterium]